MLFTVTDSTFLDKYLFDTFDQTNPTVTIALLLAVTLNVFGHVTRTWYNLLLKVLVVLMRSSQKHIAEERLAGKFFKGHTNGTWLF